MHKHQEIVSRAEELFGYPLPDGVELPPHVMLVENEPNGLWQFGCDLLVTPNIVWEFDGPDDLAEFADPNPAEAKVLAFQLIGYFSPRSNLFFTAHRKIERLRIDVTPGHRQTVVIEGGRFEPYVGPVLSFSEILEAQQATFGFFDAQRVKSPDNELARRECAASFVQTYPALAEVFWDELVKLGAPAELRPTHARETLQAPTPLFYTALSVAECLLGRKERVVVDPALPVMDRSNAASLTVGMLVKFAVDQKAGVALAHEVLAEDLGVPLTRRWAQRLLDEYPAAMRLRC